VAQTRKKKVDDFRLIRRTAMEWEKPDYVEISLSCEISSYVNAELGDTPTQAERDAGLASE
jgi:coenzyme PQQ precursor peptide PqqA